MSQRETLHPPTPYPAAPVVPWPPGEPAPALPDGKAGISVRIRKRRMDPPHFLGPRAVGVDDRPMWYGRGRAIVVTEPGEHLVEVRGRLSAETVRRVRVGAGQIVELEYWIPASFGNVDAVLVRPPARRRLGSGGWGFITGLAAAMGAILLLAAADVRPNVALVAAIFAIFIAVTVLFSLVKRRIDRRYRVAVSYEADVDAGAVGAGAFLGDGTAPPGLADDRHGVLLVTGTAKWDYSCNGLTVAAQPAATPNSWLPWPSLAIDGTPRPFSWRTWCYRLPPGPHEVTVTARPPSPSPGPGDAAADGAQGPEANRFRPEPVTKRVEIVAGSLTRLDMRVKATIKVVTTRDRDAPTKLADFAAAVELHTSAPVTSDG